MSYTFCCHETFMNAPDVTAFMLYRNEIAPVLESKRSALDGMYSAVMGRSEINPVFLMGLTLLQLMERLPDRQAVAACRYDIRWRMALDIPGDWRGIDPSTLVYFRKRLIKHGQAKLVLDAALEAMRNAGYMKDRAAVRIDSTHLVGAIAHMSRLECVRESLRLALEFLVQLNDSAAWEPWYSRYSERNPQELRNPTEERLRATMKQAGADCRQVLALAEKLEKVVWESKPIQLLRRVFEEQYEANPEITQRRALSSGSIQNPHDPEATWSTKRSIGKSGWVGYKVQVCETVVPEKRQKGEPTEAVITAVVTQPAITSDHGSVPPVLLEHSQRGNKPPGTVYADAGYISATQLVQAESDGLDLCGPMPAPPHSKGRFGTDAFDVNLPERKAVCPGGKPSSTCSCIREADNPGSYYYFEWSRADCSTCPLRAQCLSTKKREPFRTIQVSEHHMTAQKRRQECRTQDYRDRMKNRNAIEGTISELKRRYGIRRARYRGLQKTNLQILFCASGCNLRRWAARRNWMKKRQHA